MHWLHLPHSQARTRITTMITSMTIHSTRKALTTKLVTRISEKKLPRTTVVKPHPTPKSKITTAHAQHTQTTSMTIGTMARPTTAPHATTEITVMTILPAEFLTTQHIIPISTTQINTITATTGTGATNQKSPISTATTRLAA